MKIREGFVSNSSSSSFVIAINKDTIPKMKLTLEVELDEYSEYINKIENKKDLIKYFENNMYIIDYENNPKFIECCKELDNGNVIYYGEFPSFGDGGNRIQHYLANNGFKVTENNFNVIDGNDGGY